MGVALLNSPNYVEHHKTAPMDSFDLRFFLTEPELKEAFAVLHPVIGNRYTKQFCRIFNGFGALLILMVPRRFGQSWAELFVSEPVGSIFMAVVALACAWSATGIGMKALDHHLNRLDLERHITLTELGVVIIHGDRTRNYKWKRFVFFQETPDLFMLQTIRTQFWTIPKRALPSESEQSFREFLNHKLPQKGKESHGC